MKSAPRSWLFVPGDDARKQAKALHSKADALILDLEDSVAEPRKAEARDICAAFLRAPRDSSTTLYIRVNPMRGGLVLDDLAGVVGAGPVGIVLPKCEGPEDIVRLGCFLDALEARESLPRASTQIVAIVTETARGMQRLREFQDPLPRLAGLMWGGEDLCFDLGGTANRPENDQRYLSPYAYARDLCLIAARAVGVSAIDAVYTDFQNRQGLIDECRAHRVLGFDAKAAIHPAQIDAINQSFSPSAEEIEWAKSVVAAFESNTGVASFAGKMLDRPHLLSARKILARLGSSNGQGM